MGSSIQLKTIEHISPKKWPHRQEQAVVPPYAWVSQEKVPAKSFLLSWQHFSVAFNWLSRVARKTAIQSNFLCLPGIWDYSHSTLPRFWWSFDCMGSEDWPQVLIACKASTLPSGLPPRSLDLPILSLIFNMKISEHTPDYLTFILIFKINSQNVHF